MNWKKPFTLLGLLVIATLVLSGCAAQPTPAPAAVDTPAQPPAASEDTQVQAPPAEKVTINIMHNWGSDDAKGPPLQSIFKDFMAANPDITIKDEVFLDSDIPMKVETSFAAKQEPDLVFVARYGPTVLWTDAGLTVPVNDYIKSWGFEGKFKEVALSDFTQHDGKIQAFPLEGFTWPIWYNTKILEEAGVDIPKTTAELIDVAEKVRAAGYDAPFLVGGGDWTGYFFFQLVVESMLTNEETWEVMRDGDWTNPNAIKGVELFTQLRDAGVFADGIEGLDTAKMNEKFYSGEGAMMHAGAWSFGEAPPELLADVTLGGFPLPPGSPHKNPVIYSAYTAKGIYITRNGMEKLDAIKKFVQFIYQPENIALFVEQAGMTPPLKEVPVNEASLNPLFVQSLSLQTDVVMTQDLTVPAKVAPEFERLIYGAYIPGTTTEQILADLTAAYEANQ